MDPSSSDASASSSTLSSQIVTATSSANVATAAVVIDYEAIMEEPDNPELDEPDGVNVDEPGNGDVEEVDDDEVEDVDDDDDDDDGDEIDLDLSLGPPGVRIQDDQAQAQNPGLQPKVCKQCGTSNTPLWRRGPMGLKTLCNACGLKYWKQERILSTKLTLRR